MWSPGWGPSPASWPRRRSRSPLVKPGTEQPRVPRQRPGGRAEASGLSAEFDLLISLLPKRRTSSLPGGSARGPGDRGALTAESLTRRWAEALWDGTFRWPPAPIWLPRLCVQSAGK